MIEYNQEEAGIMKRADKFDNKKFEKEIKAELAQIREHDKEKADYYEKMMFSRDTVLDEAL